MANNNSFGDSEFVRSRGEGKTLLKLGAKHIHWMSIFQWPCIH
jgi:hypothetical protein